MRRAWKSVASAWLSTATEAKFICVYLRFVFLRALCVSVVEFVFYDDFLIEKEPFVLDYEVYDR